MKTRIVALTTAALALAAPAISTAPAQADPAPTAVVASGVPTPVDFSTIGFLHKITLDSSVSPMQSRTVLSRMMQQAEQAGLTVIPASSFTARHFYVEGFASDIAAAFGNRIGEPRRHPVTSTRIASSLHEVEGLVFRVQMSGWSWGSPEQGAIVGEAMQRAREAGLTIVAGPTSWGSFDVTGPMGVVIDSFAGEGEGTLSIVSDGTRR